MSASLPAESLAFVSFIKHSIYTLFQNGRWFMRIQIGPCCHVQDKIFFWILSLRKRHQGLIWIKTKEYLNAGHFGIRCIQLFRESLSRIKCTRQSRKVIWDMINTLFLKTVAVEPTFVTFLQHSQTYISGLPYDSFKFLWKTVHLKSPTIPFRIVACTFSDKLSQNSCIRTLRFESLTVSFLGRFAFWWEGESHLESVSS